MLRSYNDYCQLVVCRLSESQGGGFSSYRGSSILACRQRQRSESILASQAVNFVKAVARALNDSLDVDVDL